MGGRFKSIQNLCPVIVGTNPHFSDLVEVCGIIALLPKIVSRYSTFK
jgi:hypothetical protein